MIEPLFIAFVILQLAVIYTTKTILNDGGRELNPLMAKAFEKFGVLPSLVVSKSVVAVLVYLYVQQHEVVMSLLVLFYLIVISNNFYQINKRD